MSGGQTISTSETRIEAMQLQSSAYGVTVALLYGMSRIQGNLVWYGGFKATAHTDTQGSGGKGGGVKVQNTTYSYSASVMMGLCHGKITGIPRAWKGKQLYAGGVTPGQLHTVSEAYTVPTGGGDYTTAHAAAFAANIGVTEPGGGEGDMVYGPTTLSEGYHYTISAGVYHFLPTAEGRSVWITYQYTSGTFAQSGLAALGLTFISGVLGQGTWGPLTTLAPSQAIGYSGLALVAGQDYQLGTGAQVDNHLFEVQGPMAYSVSSSTPDVDPADIVADVLTSARYGASFSQLGDIVWWGDYNRASGLLCSPAITEQVRAADLVAMACRMTNTAPVWSAGVLKFVPYGDQALSGNGRTFTPNTTPIYDLTDDHFLDKDAPIVVAQKAPSERYNHIRIEYRNRGTWDATKQIFTGAYNIEIAEAKDQADIDVNGLRSASVEQMHWICDPTVARTVVQLLLQRSLYITNTYTFRLPWTFDRLEGMDLVTVTDLDQGLDKTPVRIVDIDDDDVLTIKCEDFPLGVASATLYPSQSGQGFLHDYNVSPGSVQTPAIFEAPVELTTTGLEVYVAARGTGTDWAGCRVWVSLDGSTYKQIARLDGGSRYGTLAGPISGASVPVNVVGGQLLSGSATDAAALATLCYLGGATPEYVAYETATLTGTNAYTLGNLVRGAYSTHQTAHAASDAFVRIDDAIARSGSLDLSYIGKTIYFKFTSFNVYGAAEESIADVPAYSYLITGVMAALPPSQPTGLSYSLEPFGIRLNCLRNPEPDVVAYAWRDGPVWDTAQILDANGGTSYPWTVQTTGTFTAWVAAIDFLGNYSTPASIAVTVPAPSMNSLTSAVVGADLQLDYSATPGAFAIGGYEARYGDTFATATVVGVYQVTRLLRPVDWGGARTWWVVPIDVYGNYGTPASTVVTITAPGGVTSSRSEVIDNNALLYWAPPLTGSLPVAYYDVRKGTTYAGGTPVGSNGNSTFAAVFEQQSGTYTYWVAAVDTAGNVGTAVGITATINQPPDYVLRVDYTSTFTGTFSGTYVEDGKLYGPSRGETYEQHFVNQSWTTPNDQITAGYPLYFEPSANSGYYEEVLDYGTVLPSTIVTVTVASLILAGAVTSSVQISYKKLIGDAWTDAPTGVLSVLLNDFRYVKVRITFTASGGDDLIEVSLLNIKLSAKLKTDSGTFTITNATTGVVVPFGVPFIDADTPIVQPAGTTPLIPVVDFTDTPNPTNFTVYLYNTSGTKVTGSGSWTARGY